MKYAVGTSIDLSGLNQTAETEPARPSLFMPGTRIMFVKLIEDGLTVLKVTPNTIAFIRPNMA